MIPKDRRFVKSDFDRVFSTGRSVRRNGVKLLYTPGSGKAAVVVARSVGCAAYRNQIKRRWREALDPKTLPSEMDTLLVIGSEAKGERGQAVICHIAALLSEVSP